MSDSLAVQHVVVARIGRTELGHAMLSFEEDVLVLMVHESERSVRVELSAVEGVYAERGEVLVALRDGSRLVFVVESSNELRDVVLGRCMVLPELTRTLRAFGSRRVARGVRDTAGEEQRRFFAPLLDARRLAATATTPADRVNAFDADALITSLHRVLQAFAAQRFAQLGPERRALETAELFDALEPLHDSLKHVREAAPRASAVSGELRPWRAWASELRASFEAADRVWVELDGVLEATPIPVPKSKAGK